MIEHADQQGITDPTLRLMGQLGTLLWAKALHGEAEPLMRRALELAEQLHGRDSPEVALRLNNLAQTLKEPVAEVLAALDRQYGSEGKPDIYFLPPEEPIAPHLDELLGPADTDAARHR